MDKDTLAFTQLNRVIFALCDSLQSYLNFVVANQDHHFTVEQMSCHMTLDLTLIFHRKIIAKK